jgi:hypothetical protein
MFATLQAPRVPFQSFGKTMLAFRSRPRNQIFPSQRSVIESLESRKLLSGSGTLELLVTVPGPIPSTAVAGAKVNDRIEVKIFNDGTGSLRGRTAVTLYASPDGTFNDTDTQVGAVTPSLVIPAGSSRNIFITVSSFPQTLDGNYFLLADVVAPSQTIQGVSGTAVDVSPGYVDLSNAITSLPAVGHPGGRISVTLDVSNLGNETATGTLDALFELSSSSNGSNPFQVANTTTHIRIKAGSAEKLHLSVPVALGSPSGNQFIVAVLDPNNVFNDSNPGNNTAISAAPVSFG